MDEKIELTSSWTLLGKNFELLRQHLDKVILLALLPSLALQLGSLLAARRDTPLGLAVYILALLWLGLNTPALYYFQIHAARGTDTSLGQAYLRGLRYLIRIAGYTLLVSIIITLGLIAFIVPGVFFIRRYILGNFYIVDQDMSITDALRISAAQSKPAAGYIWGMLGILLLCSLTAGFISLLFVGYPAVSAIVSSVSGILFTFLLPLRYIDIVTHLKAAKKSKKKQSN